MSVRAEGRYKFLVQGLVGGCGVELGLALALGLVLDLGLALEPKVRTNSWYKAWLARVE